LGAGRDFIGTTSTSASVKSLWIDFDICSSEINSGLHGQGIGVAASSGEPRSIVIGFNFVRPVRRAQRRFRERRNGAHRIFWRLRHVTGIADFFPRAQLDFRGGNFGDSVCT
jgi:hypothetical protein